MTLHSTAWTSFIKQICTGQKHLEAQNEVWNMILFILWSKFQIMKDDKRLEGWCIKWCKFPCQLLARTNDQSYFFIFKVTFSSKKTSRDKTGFVMASVMVLCNTFLHEHGTETFFMRRVTVQWVFFAIIAYSAGRFLCKNFLFHRPCQIINFALPLKPGKLKTDHWSYKKNF